jgi:hypothetical protein
MYKGSDYFVQFVSISTFQKHFLGKYGAFIEMVLKIYGNEPVIPVTEMQQLIAHL